MKKIMFNDRYRLTEAVLKGRKTMTRRTLKLPVDMKPQDVWNPTMGIDDRGKVYFAMDCIDGKQRDFYPQYQVGEVVAIAQCFKDAGVPPSFDCIGPFQPNAEFHAGWTNKMYVTADLMPHRIRITNIKVERLQDISDEDCLREGITTITEGKKEVGNGYGWDTKVDALERDTFFTARQAFAALIDRISGRDTWQRNPWMYAYEFELVQ